MNVLDLRVSTINVALWAMVMSSPVHAKDFGNDTAFGSHVISQLACRSIPDPTETFLFLNKFGFINLKDREGADSVTCFKIQKPLSIAGLPISYVCGYVEDYLFHDLFPKLYYRGPGTSPGQQIVLGTTASKQDVESWVNREVAGYAGKFAGSVSSESDQYSVFYMESPSKSFTQIGCNSMSLPRN